MSTFTLPTPFLPPTVYAGKSASANPENTSAQLPIPDANLSGAFAGAYGGFQAPEDRSPPPGADAAAAAAVVGAGLGFGKPVYSDTMHPSLKVPLLQYNAATGHFSSTVAGNSPQAREVRAAVAKTAAPASINLLSFERPRGNSAILVIGLLAGAVALGAVVGRRRA